MFSPYARKLLPPLICLGLAGCGASPKPRAELEDTVKKQASAAKDELSGLQSAVMKGAELKGGDTQGRPLWSLGAREIHTLSDPNADIAGGPKRAVLHDARATLYFEGKPDTKLTAPHIDMFNTPTGIRLHLTGGVTAVSVGQWTAGRGPVTMKAPQADVDVQRRIIAASGGVKMNQAGMNVRSAAARSQTSLNTMQLTGGVTADGQGSQMKAVSADWDWENNKVLARQPIATKDDVRIVGAEMTADTQAQRGVVTGNVVATSPKGEARGPKMNFDWGKDRIEASPAVMTGKDGTLHASTLVTDSKLQVSSGENITVEKDGATIRARKASGFNKLTRIQGSDVTYVKEGTTVTAGEATWGAGKVLAKGGVTLVRAGLRVNAAQVAGDDALNNADATGGVSGTLPNGGTFKAPAAQKRGDTILADNATTTVPQQGQFGKLTMRGDHLVTDSKGENATLRGNVVVTSQSGAVMKAPEAHYTRATGKVTARGGVYFKDPRGLEQRGDSLVADVNLKQATLTNVQGQGTQKLFEGKQLFR